jgi:hypothetical protein
MPTPHPDHLKRQLARWVAADRKVASWCQQHGVPRRTAYRWCGSAWFQRLVARYRRPTVDRAVGRMASHMTRAVETIDRLVERGETDAVKLSAARVVITSLLDIGGHAEVSAEIRRLSDRIDSLR